jgi:hypothetical protein
LVRTEDTACLNDFRTPIYDLRHEQLVDWREDRCARAGARRLRDDRRLSPKYFRNLVVDEGGYGAGTRIRFDMTVLGRTTHCRAVIEEPQPGRVLVERELESGAVTTFEVEPVGDVACLVSIRTEMPRKPGIAGAVEKFLASRVLPRIYREELLRLEDVARGRSRT